MPGLDISSGVSVRVFLGEISPGIHGLSKVDCAPHVGGHHAGGLDGTKGRGRENVPLPASYLPA